MTNLNLKYLFGLTPEEAIAYLKAKGYHIGWDWHETLNKAHARSFTVAKVMRTDILEDIRAEVQKGLDNGITYAEFKSNLIPRLKAKGWWGEVVNEQTGEVANFGPHRLRTIFDTNVQTAYMAGHYRSAMENTADRPWWMYTALMDKRTRPAHAALNGLVFRFDDPFWNSHFPPNGFRCRCSVRFLDDDGMKGREGAQRSTVGPDANARLSEVEKPLAENKTTMVTAVKTKSLDGSTVAMAPDAGWSYNPGKAGWQKPFIPPPLDEKPRPVAATLTKPGPLPPATRVSSAMLLGDGLAPEKYYEHFLQEFPSETIKTGLFKDVTDEPVLITPDLFKDNRGNWKITKRNRHRSVRLLARTIIDPDELWEFWKERGPRGPELRRRYLKRFVIDEDSKEVPALAIFEKGKSGWLGETVFPVEQKTAKETEKYFEKMRGDVLRYRRGERP